MKFWCATAFMETRELIAVSTMLDEYGYHGLMVSDHLVFPQQLESKYPYSPFDDGRPMWQPETAWPDPWVLIGAMAAVTTQLQFTTNIYVAPMRPLLQVAKEVSTASVISSGRVALGAGAGWMREEFELQGQSYTNRGKRFTEMVLALREMWKPGWVEFHGDYYDVPACTMEPTPADPIPIYIGGHSDAALRRAAQVGDGWIGNAYPLEEAAVPFDSADVTMLPSTSVLLDSEAAAKAVLKLVDLLDDNDDVEGVYGNFDVADEILTTLSLEE